MLCKVTVVHYSLLCRLGLCHFRDYDILDYVVRDYVTLGIPSFGIVLFDLMCALVYFVRDYVVWYTVGVSPRCIILPNYSGFEEIEIVCETVLAFRL